MESLDPAVDPPVDALQSVFHLYETQRDGDRILYYGESLVPEQMLIREAWPAFREAGYEIELASTETREDIVVARPIDTGIDGFPWKNMLLFLATIVSTLLVGAITWYYIPPSDLIANPLTVLRAWPFTAAILGVLATHELGHYVMGRYHGVNVSLPYVIPFIFPFGTLGAIIRMRGQMPDRRALFDIGVAGPLAGLAATVIVTIIGLTQSPIQIPARAMEQSGQMIIIIIGGWVGMFFTVLNLLPVGQLDGGHILRAMLGSAQERIAALVPVSLIALAAYLHYGLGYAFNESVGLWAFWGVLSAFVAFKGPANPIDDTPLDIPRVLLGVITFALGALCFLIVPIEVATVG